jgi:hypothetical protein
MKQGAYFYPTSSNKGGESTIETHRINHILSILNAKSAINSLQRPHPCVKGPKLKKIDFLYEYNEVLTSFKKVIDMKHGYVNHSAPKTYHLKNSIGKQQVFEKNVILHDHLRNINHLAKSLTDMEKKYDKKFDQIKNTNTHTRKFGMNSAEYYKNKNNATNKIEEAPFKIKNNNNKFNKSSGKNESIDYYEASSIINERDLKNKFYNYDSFNYMENERKIEEKNEKQKNNIEISKKIYNHSLELIKFCNDEELLKKNVINFIVTNKIYEKEEFDYLKSILMEKNSEESNVLRIHNVMMEIEDQFFK